MLHKLTILFSAGKTVDFGKIWSSTTVMVCLLQSQFVTGPGLSVVGLLWQATCFVPNGNYCVT